MTGKIQKGLLYLKNRGIREFTARAAEKLADAHFDYNRWVCAQEPSPLEMGYQKYLKMGSMPKIWVMILRPEGEPVRGKAFRRTEETLRRQTYLNAELCDALTTQVGDEDLIVFVRAGDLLPPHALFELARAVLDGSSCVYSDEDRYRLVKDGDREIYSARKIKVAPGEMESIMLRKEVVADLSGEPLLVGMEVFS